MQNYKCTICFRNIKTKSSKILLNEKFVTKCKCKYYYHERCIKTWMKIKKTCPICRKTIFYNKYDMYKILMKNFCWITKEIFFVCTPIFFNFIWPWIFWSIVMNCKLLKIKNIRINDYNIFYLAMDFLVHGHELQVVEN